VLSALVVSSFFDEGPAFLPAGTLEAFRTDLRLTYAQVGVVLSMVAVGSVIGSAGSIAIDHVSRRLLTAAGATLLAGSMAGFALSPWYEGLLAASFVQGFAATVMMDTTGVALTDLVGEERLRPYLARANLAGAAGDLAGPILLGAVVGLGLGWRIAFAVAAVIVGLYAILLALAPLPGPSGGENQGHTPMAGLVQVLRDPQVWLIGWISFLAVPFDEPFLGFLLARAQESGLGAGATTAVALLSVGGGIAAYGYLESRLRALPDRVLIGSGALLALAGSVIAGVLDGVVPLAGGGGLVGIGLALSWLALEHRQLTLRPGQEGTTRGVIGAIESVGLALPIATGALIDATSLSFGLTTHAGVAAMIVVSLVWMRP
jgi:predicted MFS family arabinose efflux permease